MAQPFAGTVSISTATSTSAITSTGVMLDPTARVTNVFLTGPSTTADVCLQVTLQTAMSTGTTIWTDASTTHLSYSAGNEGVTYTFLSPIAGLRLASTALTSGTVTMKVLQSIIG